MASFGILAALHERERSGEGQVVDASMTDGALSWLAMVAAAFLRDGRVPRRGSEMLNGGVACYLPYQCADGWVSCGALEPKFWKAFCDGTGREDLLQHQFARPGSEGHAAVAEVFRGRTRAEWAAFNDEHDCCIEPVLDLDEALDSELVRAREMVVEVEQPELGTGPPARASGEALPDPGRPDPSGSGARRAHGGGARRGRDRRRRDRGAPRRRCRGRPGRSARAGEVPLVSPQRSAVSRRSGEGAAEDLRARRARRRPGGDRPPLPARGAARPSR